MKKKITSGLNAISTGLLFSGLLASSLSMADVPDAASRMPDISHQKILVGYWDNGIADRGQPYGYEFLSRYQSILASLSPGKSRPAAEQEDPESEHCGSHSDHAAALADEAGSQPDIRGQSQPPAQVQEVKATLKKGQVTLSWQPAQGNAEVTGYSVWRDQEKVADTPMTRWYDNQVRPGQTYRYTVTAYNAANNVAPHSLPVTVTLPQPHVGPDKQESRIRAFTPGQSYVAGDKVLYGGKVYRCLNAHTGARHWAPDKAVSLWAAE